MIQHLRALDSSHFDVGPLATLTAEKMAAVEKSLLGYGDVVNTLELNNSIKYGVSICSRLLVRENTHYQVTQMGFMESGTFAIAPYVLYIVTSVNHRRHHSF